MAMAMERRRTRDRTIPDRHIISCRSRPGSPGAMPIIVAATIASYIILPRPKSLPHFAPCGADNIGQLAMASSGNSAVRTYQAANQSLSLVQASGRLAKWCGQRLGPTCTLRVPFTAGASSAG